MPTRSRGRLGRPVLAIQRLLELITVALGGEHFSRRPLQHVQAAGLDIERQDRFKLGMVERLAARKAADPPPDRASSTES